jgi:hypothetical protein
MMVGLGPFVRQGIEDRLGPDVPAGVEIALLFYLGRLNSGRGVPSYPSFLQNGGSEAPDAEVELNVGAEVEELISGEAERQHITVDRFAAHSVFIYLAELDRVEQEAAAGNYEATN